MPLTIWIRSRSAPKQSNNHEETAHHFPSDGYPDSEMADALKESSFKETLRDSTSDDASYNAQATSKRESPENEDFYTPPTTPPQTNNSRIEFKGDARIEARADAKSENFPFLPVANHEFFPTKKRPCPDLEPMRPPPTRRVTREQKTDEKLPTCIAPMPSTENDSFMSRSSNSSHSFDNLSSVSLSFTSASPAWTSPNTSFSSNSLATSFDSTSEETDSAVKPLTAHPHSRQFGDQISLWSGHEITKSHNDENKSRFEDLNPYPIRSNQVSHAARDAVDSTKIAIQSNQKVESHLLKRLISHTPFGSAATAY